MTVSGPVGSVPGQPAGAPLPTTPGSAIYWLGSFAHLREDGRWVDDNGDVIQPKVIEATAVLPADWREPPAGQVEAPKWVDLFGAAPDLPAEQFGIDPDPDPLRAVIREALTHLECGRALLAEDLLRGSLPGGDTND